MARPPNADSSRTIDNIVSSALALLDESRRVEDLSLRQVAQRANVGLSTVQYYFATRDALLDACLEGYHQRLVSLAEALVAELSASEIHVVIDKAVRAFYRFALRERTLIQLRVSTTLTHREARTRARDELGAGIIRRAGDALAPQMGVTVSEARFAVHAMSALIVRSALASEVELKTLTDAGTPECFDAIEAQLVRAAFRLLSPR